MKRSHTICLRKSFCSASSRLRWLLRCSLPALLVIGLEMSTSGTLRAAAGYYFDPNHHLSDSGGTGTFDMSTANFYNGLTGGSAADVVFPGNQAVAFDGTPGTVSVSGQPTPTNISINASSIGTYTFQTSGGASDAIVLSPAGTGGVVTVSSGNKANIVFTVPLQLALTPGVYTYNSYFTIGSNTSTTYGAITATGGDLATDVLDFSNTGGGKTYFNGAITNSLTSGVPTIRFNYTGNAASTYTLQSGFSATGISIQLATGTVYDQVSLGTGNLTIGGTWLLEGAGVSVARTIYNAYGTIGGDTADSTSFTSSVNINTNSTLTFTAASGGRVDFNGSVAAAVGGKSVISGQGVVSFNNATGNNDSNPATGVTTPVVGTEISNGAHFIVKNTSNSGTGTSINTVQVDAGGTFGGTGSTSQAVTALGATSVISPGDLSAALVSSVGTLKLSGGLTASSGLTLNFDLQGTTGSGYDVLNMASSALTLGGNVTLNFTDIGNATLSTGTDYNLITNIAAVGSSFNAATFTLNAPAGYTASIDPASLQAGATTFAVQFTAAPEPETWALLGLGLALIGFVGRARANRGC